jgi:hypothetical protein
MSDTEPIDAQAIQFLYSLWDASLPGRQRVLAWETPPKVEASLSQEESPDIQQLLRYLNRIGHLVEKALFPAGFVEEFFGKEILRCHTRLEPLLSSSRTQRDDPSYLEFIDRLADRCKQRWPNYTPTYYPKASTGAGFL